MQHRVNPVWFVLALLALVCHLGYILLGRAWLIDQLGNPESWLTVWLSNWYPGLATRLLAGNMQAIFERADTFPWRIWMVLLLSYSAIQWLPRFIRNIQIPIDREAANTLLVAWLTVQTFFTYDLWIDLLLRSDYSALYLPLPVWKWMVPHFPSEAGLHVLFVVYLVGLLAITNQKWSTIGLTVSWAMFLLLQVLQMGFGKIEHTYISFTLSGIWLIVFQRNKETRFLMLAQLTVALCYFFAGVEKFLIKSGQWWADGALSDYSSLIAANEFPAWAEWVMLIWVIFFQLSAPFFVLGGYGRIFAWQAIIFHISTYLLMDVGGLVSPWLAALLIFIIPGSNHRKPA